MKNLLIGLFWTVVMLVGLWVWVIATAEHPAMPITVKTRDGLIGKVVNVSAYANADSFWADVTVSSPTGNVKQHGTAYVCNWSSTDLGWMQGFTIESGDWVRIHSSRHRDRLVWVW